MLWLMPFCMKLFLMNWILFSTKSITHDDIVFQYQWMSLIMTNISLRGFSISIRSPYFFVISKILIILKYLYSQMRKFQNRGPLFSMVLAWIETWTWIVLSNNRTFENRPVAWNHFWNKMPDRLTLSFPFISKCLHKWNKIDFQIRLSSSLPRNKIQWQTWSFILCRLSIMQRSWFCILKHFIARRLKCQQITEGSILIWEHG